MPISYSKPVSGSQLVTGIIGTIDMGAVITKVIEVTLETQHTQEILTRLNTYLDSQTTVFIPRWSEWASKDFESIKKDLLDWWTGGLKFVTSNIRNQVMQSALGYGATASMLGLETKYYSSIVGIDTLTDALYGIPQQIVTRKSERYWNKQLAPEDPSDKDAFMLYRLGLWSRTAYVNRMREHEGLKAKDAEDLTDMREWQTGVPSLRDAYLMVQKGLWTKTDFINEATKGFGFTKDDAEILYQHFSYDFSPSELLRLSDLIPLDSAWVEKKLLANGLNSEDKDIFKSAIEKRQIRDEVNKTWALLLDCYQWGLVDKVQITLLLTNWKFSKTEIDLRIQTGDLLKLKLRVKLLRDAEIYLYRKGTITESELLERLVGLSIGLDVANAITRNEASKKGIEWEIPSD